MPAQQMPPQQVHIHQQAPPVMSGPSYGMGGPMSGGYGMGMGNRMGGFGGMGGMGGMGRMGGGGMGSMLGPGLLGGGLGFLGGMAVEDGIRKCPERIVFRKEHALLTSAQMICNMMRTWMAIMMVT